jgi:hypothetical protein
VNPVRACHYPPLTFLFSRLLPFWNQSRWFSSGLALLVLSFEPFPVTQPRITPWFCPTGYQNVPIGKLKLMVLHSYVSLRLN